MFQYIKDAARSILSPVILQVNDGVINKLIGYGGINDPESYLTYTLDEVTHDELVALYRGSWIARKAVDIVANDMTKKWRSIENDYATEFTKLEQAFNLDKVMNKALKLSRIYGTSFVFMCFDGDEDYSTPIDYLSESVQLSSLTVLSCKQLKPVIGNLGDVVTDPNSPHYGYPKIYEIATQSSAPIKIHYTRLVRIEGGEIPLDESQQKNNSYSDSILAPIYRNILRYESGHKDASILLKESSVSVMKAQKLADKLRDDEGGTLKAYKQIARNKSLINALILDSEDEYVKVNNSMTGVDSIINLFIDDLCGATNIPKVKFFGRQASGLSNNGETEITAYNEWIETEQEAKLRPALRPIDVLLLKKLNQTLDEFNFTFKPLSQMTAMEKATIKKTNAEADKLNIEMGATPEIIAKQWQSDGTYVGVDDNFVDELSSTSAADISQQEKLINGDV